MWRLFKAAVACHNQLSQQCTGLAFNAASVPSNGQPLQNSFSSFTKAFDDVKNIEATRLSRDMLQQNGGRLGRQVLFMSAVNAAIIVKQVSNGEAELNWQLN